MTNAPLSRLSENELHQRTFSLVQEERRITLELIESLREIQARRLHESLGFPSLHQFCTGHLGLSDGAAARRISALHLSRDVPEVREKLQSGELTLSSASTLQTFFRNQKKLGQSPTPQEKRAVIARVKGLSRKDTEKTLFSIQPEALPRERERVVSADETELKLVLNEKTLQKFKRLQAYWSHSLKEGTRAELLERMLDKCLEREERKRFGKPAHSAAERVHKPQAASPPKNLQRPAVPAAIRHEVWNKAQGQCEYVSPAGMRCASRSFLQIDHIDVWSTMAEPKHELPRLRLLCWAHNVHYAVQTLGPRVMAPFSSSTRP